MHPLGRQGDIAACKSAQVRPGFPVRVIVNRDLILKPYQRWGMGKLRLGPIPDDKPIRRAIQLPAALDADLRAYADLLAAEMGQRAPAVEKLISVMLERFIQTDREFLKSRRTSRMTSAIVGSNSDNQTLLSDTADVQAYRYNFLYLPIWIV
jgi:hypothetical protein